MRASTFAALAILFGGCTEARVACVRDADCPAFQRCSDGMCSPLVCDGPDASRGPDAMEVVGDEIDQNCDGAEVCFVDDDMDGFRSIDPREITSSDADCTDPGEARASLPATDCDDASAAKSPSAPEACNAIDDDCANGPDDGFACPIGSVEGCVACGFSGARSCSSACTWGACGGYAISSAYDDTVTPFGHACGYDCGDGDWCILGAPAGGCDIVSSGPGLAVPIGRYEVDFYFGDTGTYDFFVYAGGALAGSTTFTATAGFPHVVVPFSVGADCAAVSVRLFGRSGARIRLYTVTIRRVGD